jgi:hypothetical protein
MQIIRASVVIGLEIDQATEEEGELEVAPWSDGGDVGENS